MGRPTTRDRLLRSAISLVRRQGYAGTGLKEIAKSGDARWSSMYHFFPEGKDQLISEAISLAAGRYKTLIRRVFDTAEHPADGARAWFELSAAALEESDFRDGCPVATAALEAASTNDRVRQAAAEAFESWTRWTSEKLAESGVDEHQAHDVTVFALAALEGAILLSRVQRSSAPLRITGEKVEAALRTALPRPADS